MSQINCTAPRRILIGVVGLAVAATAAVTGSTPASAVITPMAASTTTHCKITTNWHKVFSATGAKGLTVKVYRVVAPDDTYAFCHEAKKVGDDTDSTATISMTVYLDKSTAIYNDTTGARLGIDVRVADGKCLDGGLVNYRGKNTTIRGLCAPKK